MVVTHTDTLRVFVSPVWVNLDETPCAQRLLMKGRITGGAEFLLQTVSCDISHSGALQSAAAVTLSCRYWGLNYLFYCMHYWGLNDPFCCIHCNIDSQCFSIGRATLKIAPSREGSQPPCNACFLGPTWVISLPNSISISSAVSTQHVHVTNTETDHDA